MKNIFHAAILSLAFIGPAYAEGVQGFINGLFPSSVRPEFSDVTGSGDFFRAGQATLRGDDHDIAVRDISVSRSESGALALRIKTATVHPHLNNAPSVTISGLNVSLSGAPIFGQNTTCAWLDRISSLDLEHIRISTRDVDGSGNNRYDLNGVRYRPAKASMKCSLSGIAGVKRATVNFKEGQSLDILDLRLEGLLPGAPEIAETSRDVSRLRASAETTQYSHSSNMPILGFSNLNMTIQSETKSLAGLLTVMAMNRAWSSPRPSEFLLMQLVNAVTMVSADISVNSSGFRIYTPGLLPAEAVTNFSRAGLSTLNAKGAAKINLRYGDFITEMNTSITGISDVEMSARAKIEPYSKEKLTVGAAGRKLGYHLIPDLSINYVQAMIADKGLNSAVINLTGVPAGRYLEEIGSQSKKASSEGEQRFAMIGIRSIASFIRVLSEGQPMSVQIAPKEPVKLIDAMILALRDVTALTDAIGISYDKIEE